MALLEESQGALSVEDTEPLSETIVGAVEDHDGPGSIDTRILSTPGRRLLELVPRALIQTWSENRGSHPGQLLRILEAIETVRAATDFDPAEDPVDRLCQMDGSELLLEVAHDLRSPLTAIMFLAETLQKRLSGDLNELQDRQVGLIYSGALGLSELVSNVLELSRGGKQLAERERSPFSVTDILQSVVPSCNQWSRKKSFSFASNHRRPITTGLPFGVESSAPESDNQRPQVH